MGILCIQSLKPALKVASIQDFKCKAEQGGMGKPICILDGQNIRELNKEWNKKVVLQAGEKK